MLRRTINRRKKCILQLKHTYCSLCKDIKREREWEPDRYPYAITFYKGIKEFSSLPLFPACCSFLLNYHLKFSFPLFSLCWTSEVSVGTADMAGIMQSVQMLHNMHTYTLTFICLFGGETGGGASGSTVLQHGQCIVHSPRTSLLHVRNPP